MDCANMKTVLNVCLVAALILFTGCTSISARWRGERGRPYPGVRMDMEHVKNYQTEGELVALIDLPLSALVDTLFYPYDVAVKEAPAPKDPPAPKDRTQSKAE